MVAPKPAAAKADRKPTLAMVAASAGVSSPTASKVLNGRADVAPETRARVERAMRELRYTPASRRGRSDERIVEIVFDDLLNPYAAEVIDGATDAGLAADVTVLPRRLTDDAGGDWAKRVQASGRDGIIVVTSVLTPAQIARFDDAGLPVVVIDTLNSPRADIVSIGSTNFQGGVSATEHLLGLGHRRIAHIGGPQTLACSVARLHGYRAALEQAGVAADPDLVAIGGFDYASGLEIAARWLDRRDPPSAVFAASDQIAFGVLEAARRRGLRVPADLSVVGFDDTYAASTSSPALTTVHQPLREMGGLAVRTLLGLCDGAMPAYHHLELATRLEVRDSTAAPRRSRSRG